MREIFHILSLSFHSCLQMEPPPLIFIEGSHPLLGREMGMEPLEPTSSSNEELPRQNLKVVGPMGWSADQGGQPTTLLGRPTFSFFGWATSGVHLLMVVVWAFVLLTFFSGGLLIHVWRCLISRCLLLGQKGMIALHFHLKPALIEI